MSQLEDLNRAMAYIEEHLDGTVDMDVLARIAVCSKYQLQRMFYAVIIIRQVFCMRCFK